MFLITVYFQSMQSHHDYRCQLDTILKTAQPNLLREVLLQAPKDLPITSFVDSFVNFAGSEVDGVNTAMCSSFLDAGMPVNQFNKHGWAAIHNARTPHMLDFLIERGASVNLRDVFGRTPIHVYAASSLQDTLGDMPGMTVRLAHAGANLNLRNKNGETALHSLVNSFIKFVPPTLTESEDIHEKFKIHLSALIKAGGNVNARNLSGATAISLLCEKINDGGFTFNFSPAFAPLMDACAVFDPDIFDEGSGQMEAVALSAVMDNNLPLLTRLIDMGLSSSSEGAVPNADLLDQAVCLNNAVMVSTLLERGWQIDKARVEEMDTVDPNNACVAMVRTHMSATAARAAAVEAAHLSLNRFEADLAPFRARI